MAHIDTYVSPASWTDFDMDWESPNSQKACYVDALLQAVKERGSVRYGTGYSTPYIAPDALLSYQALYVIHLFILSMIPYFLDPESPTAITTGSLKEIIGETDYYTDYNYGSYQGGTINNSLPLNYLTLSSICEKLGISEILSPQPYARDNSAWLRQSYDIVNMLKITATANNNTPVKYYQYRTKYRNVNTDPPRDVTTDWYGWFDIDSMFDCRFSRDATSRSCAETQIKLGIHFPTSWKLLGYIQIQDTGVGNRKYFKSNYAANPGYWYIELENDFQEGLQDFSFSLGSLTEFLPIPPEGEYYGCQIYTPQDFIIEHDFKFKQEL